MKPIAPIRSFDEYEANLEQERKRVERALKAVEDMRSRPKGMKLWQGALLCLIVAALLVWISLGGHTWKP